MFLFSDHTEYKKLETRRIKGTVHVVFLIDNGTLQTFVLSSGNSKDLGSMSTEGIWSSPSSINNRRSKGHRCESDMQRCLRVVV